MSGCPNLKKKGHEKQYNFIEDMKDRGEAATDLLSKVTPATLQDTAAIEAAKDELEQGMKTLSAL